MPDSYIGTDSEGIVGENHQRTAGDQPAAGVKVWTGQAHPRAVSSSGRWLCVQDRTPKRLPDEEVNLALIDLETGDQRLLTTGGSWVRGYPNAWSGRVPITPDGTTVAVRWNRIDGTRWDVRLINVHNTEVEVIVDRDPQFNWVFPLAWSRDGSELAMLAQRIDSSFELQLYSLSTHAVRARESLGHRSPQSLCYSPNDRFIAFDLDREVFVLPRELGGERPRHVGEGRLLAWTEQGVVVTTGGISGPSGQEREVAAIPVTDGHPNGARHLLSDHHIGDVLGVTEAGNCFHSLFNVNRVTDVFIAGIDISSWTMGQPERVASAQGDSSVVWSPGGDRLVYLKGGSIRSGLPFVIRSTADDSERLVLVDSITRGAPGHAFQPQWSPDGRSLLAQGMSEQLQGGIYRVDPETGQVVRILQAKGSAIPEWPVWCPDGRVIFTRWEPWTNVIVAFDPVTAHEEVLLRVNPPHAVAHLSASPDGRCLAFVGFDPSSGRATVLVMPSSGGDSRELVDIPHPAMPSYHQPLVQLAWTPDSKAIVYASSTTDRTLSFSAIPVRGGRPRRFGPTMEGVVPYGLSLHPEGHRLAFVAGHPSFREVWVVPGLFRRT